MNLPLRLFEDSLDEGCEDIPDRMEYVQFPEQKQGDGISGDRILFLLKRAELVPYGEQALDYIVSHPECWKSVIGERKWRGTILPARRSIIFAGNLSKGKRLLLLRDTGDGQLFPMNLPLDEPISDFSWIAVKRTQFELLL